MPEQPVKAISGVYPHGTTLWFILCVGFVGRGIVRGGDIFSPVARSMASRTDCASSGASPVGGLWLGFIAGLPGRYCLRSFSHIYCSQFSNQGDSLWPPPMMSMRTVA